MLTLHGAIDDATGAILALQLRPHEDLHGYVALLHELITTSGVPLALYGDGLNVFARNFADADRIRKELVTAQRGMKPSSR